MYPSSTTNGTHCHHVIVADSVGSIAELLASRLSTSLTNVTQVGHADSIAAVSPQLAGNPYTLVVSGPRLKDGSVLDLLKSVRSSSSVAQVVVWADLFPMFLPPEEFADFLPRSLPLPDLEARLQGLLNRGIQHPHGEPHWSTRPGAISTSSRTESPLTQRQAEVLILTARGLSVKEIAQKLQMTSKAIDSLKFRMMRSLNLHNRVDLARLAIREGLIDP
jgi:DNA-binding NarL/FixJ family response regulator